MAKSAESILAADLFRRVPMRAFAEQAGVSESSLKDHFHAVFGEGVSDHLERLRMERAEALLREGKLSVLEVSRVVDFANQGKFSAFFAKHAVCMPREYRRRG
ncbi:MAG: AraC family transcriptional regulator [Olsenella sp.]|nr:AraC family transcriptional regulator [Olsenella sp.]